MVFTNKRVKRLSDRMKSLNPKRIAAVVGGAALLATGLAFAGPISFQNVPIISNSGQPLVQIVVGTLAKPSDGVAAANLAAAIGNLAYTSVPVTASVNTTQAAKVLHAVIPSSAKYSLTNQQVYFNESTTAYISGTYQFSALIGSVFNQGTVSGQYGVTKKLQSASQYAYPSSNSITVSGTATSTPSPYTQAGSVPFDEFVSNNINGGGLTFNSLSSSNYDNLIAVTNTQLPSLLSGAGQYGESEYLWLTGIPVFDQGVNGQINQFNATNVGGAYQAVFSSPISFRDSSNSINNAHITLLGQNWTIINYELPGTTAFNTLNNVKQITSTTTASGGELSLASSLLPEKTVYVGQNYSTGGANNFTVQVADIGQPNSNGISPAALKVYYNGVLYNVSSVAPNVTAKFNDSGHNLYVKVYSTFAGLYAYEKYAKIQLYSNVVNVTSGTVFNSTYDKGWKTTLLWTNNSAIGNANELQSIIIYNTSPTHLSPGQSFNFIANPAMYKITFEQPAFGSGTYNPVQLSTSLQGSIPYSNPANTPAVISEPAQILTVSAPSSLSSAFNPGQPSNKLQYNLIPYSFSTTGTVSSNTVSVSLSGLGSLPEVANLITTSHPVQVQVQGLVSNSLQNIGTLQFNSYPSTTKTLSLPTGTTEITNITLLNYPVYGLTITAAAGGNTATLTAQGPEAMYIPSGKTNYTLVSSSTIQTFNQNNGQRPDFTLTTLTKPSSPLAVGSNSYEFFNYTMSEYPVPSNQTTVDSFTVGLVNATNGGLAAQYIMNYSGRIGTSAYHNNVTYSTNSQSVNSVITAKQGFYSERGSEVASISPTSVTINFARGVDMLNFVVGPSNITAVTKNYKVVGPVGIGQPVPNVPNVTVANVTANISVSDVSGATVTGISNLTATPSISTATTPVLLKNLTTSPLVVLNSTANPSSNLILIGSGFVNGLSAQVQSANNVTFTPTSAPVLQSFGTDRILVAGYYANQTTAEANKLIADLYASASTS